MLSEKWILLQYTRGHTLLAVGLEGGPEMRGSAWLLQLKLFSWL